MPASSTDSAPPAPGSHPSDAYPSLGRPRSVRALSSAALEESQPWVPFVVVEQHVMPCVCMWFECRFGRIVSAVPCRVVCGGAA